MTHREYDKGKIKNALFIWNKNWTFFLTIFLKNDYIKLVKMIRYLDSGGWVKFWMPDE